MKFRLAVLLSAALFAAACVKQVPAKTYAMHGTVVNLDEQSHLAKINAGQLGDWMSPMTMDYPVPNKTDWAELKAGQQIDATVFVRGDEFWVADIHPAGKK